MDEVCKTVGRSMSRERSSVRLMERRLCLPTSIKQSRFNPPANQVSSRLPKATFYNHYRAPAWRCVAGQWINGRNTVERTAVIKAFKLRTCCANCLFLPFVFIRLIVNAKTKPNLKSHCPCKHIPWEKIHLLTSLWRPLLPYGYSYKASYTRPR